MRGIGAIISAAAVIVASSVARGRIQGQEPKEGPATSTKQFEVRSDRPFLGGEQIDIWGLRCGNALYSPAVTDVTSITSITWSRTALTASASISRAPMPAGRTPRQA
jgi:hypothetical protein